MVEKEKMYLKCRFREEKRCSIFQFKTAQGEFDKKLKNAKRNYNLEILTDREWACYSSPN